MSGVMLPYGDAVTTYEVRDNPSENHGNEWPLPPAAVWRIHAARGTRRDATGTGMGMGRDATGMGRCTFPWARAEVELTTGMPPAFRTLEEVKQEMREKGLNVPDMIPQPTY